MRQSVQDRLGTQAHIALATTAVTPRSDQFGHFLSAESAALESVRGARLRAPLVTTSREPYSQ